MVNDIQEKYLCINLHKCTGCRSCELACSWHFYKTFNPEASAIKVNRYDEEIELYINSTCDLCYQEDIPLCIKYCAPKALKYL